jgi:hypothetical protein
MRAICKVRGFTLLLWVGTLWRCSDGPFFKVPPLESNALLTMLHPLLENVLQTVDHFKISCLRASFSWLEKPRYHMGRDLNWILCLAWKRWISGTPLEHLPYSPDLAPCDFWAFPTMKREIWGKKFPSDQWSCSTFLRSGWSIVRSASLAKGGTLKKRQSLHLHKVLAQSNNVSPWTLQMALIDTLESPLNVSQFNFIPHLVSMDPFPLSVLYFLPIYLMHKVCGPYSVIAMTNLFHLRFSLILYTISMLPATSSQ